LLDEPLSALDAKVRVHLRHEVRQLQRRLGITTIMVTHDQEEALTMADRIVVMDHGIIVQVGSPVDVYRSPATPFVAEFVGTMNFLTGEVIGSRSLRLGNVELACENGVDGAAMGEKVTVCVRPEDLKVRGTADGTSNAVGAHVEDLEFLGAFYRATLTVDGMRDQPVRADFAPNVVQDFALREGAKVTVVFPDDRMRVFEGR
jgi:iron(III) transport system ATP-binding protein